MIGYLMVVVPEIADWKALRLALGLTQRAWAEILCVSPRHIRWLEAGTVKAGGPLRALALSWANDPLARSRLKAAGYLQLEKELPMTTVEVGMNTAPLEKGTRTESSIGDTEFYDPLSILGNPLSP
mgnify:CR=1 FL=1